MSNTYTTYCLCVCTCHISACVQFVFNAPFAFVQLERIFKLLLLLFVVFSSFNIKLLWKKNNTPQTPLFLSKPTRRTAIQSKQHKIFCGCIYSPPTRISRNKIDNRKLVNCQSRILTYTKRGKQERERARESNNQSTQQLKTIILKWIDKFLYRIYSHIFKVPGVEHSYTLQ